MTDELRKAFSSLNLLKKIINHVVSRPLNRLFACRLYFFGHYFYVRVHIPFLQCALNTTGGVLLLIPIFLGPGTHTQKPP